MLRAASVTRSTYCFRYGRGVDTALQFMNAWGRGVVRGVKGEQFPVADTPWGREITAWGAEKAQQCHKYFLL